MAEIPVEVFRHGLMTQMVKHVRPPTRRDLGKKVRKLKPISTCRAVAEEMLVGCAWAASGGSGVGHLSPDAGRRRQADCQLELRSASPCTVVGVACARTTLKLCHAARRREQVKREVALADQDCAFLMVGRGVSR